MVIDGFALSGEELMKAVRDALRTRVGHDEIEVVISNSADAVRVKAYLKMSGLQVQILKTAGRWNVRAYGASCGCA